VFKKDIIVKLHLEDYLTIPCVLSFVKKVKILIYSKSMKKGPIIIVALLIAFLLFIGGMQYGKRVETANKAIAIILSITPPPYTITIIPHKYITVTNENCGL